MQSGHVPCLYCSLSHRMTGGSFENLKRRPGSWRMVKHWQKNAIGAWMTQSMELRKGNFDMFRCHLSSYAGSWCTVHCTLPARTPMLCWKLLASTLKKPSQLLSHSPRPMKLCLHQASLTKVIVSQMLTDYTSIVIHGGCEAGGLWRATSSFGSAFCSNLQSFTIKEFKEIHLHAVFTVTKPWRKQTFSWPGPARILMLCLWTPVGL